MLFPAALPGRGVTGPWPAGAMSCLRRLPAPSRSCERFDFKGKRIVRMASLTAALALALTGSQPWAQDLPDAPAGSTDAAPAPSQQILVSGVPAGSDAAAVQGVVQAGYQQAMAAAGHPAALTQPQLQAAADAITAALKKAGFARRACLPARPGAGLYRARRAGARAAGCRPSRRRLKRPRPRRDRRSRRCRTTWCRRCASAKPARRPTLAGARFPRAGRRASIRTPASRRPACRRWPMPS